MSKTTVRLINKTERVLLAVGNDRRVERDKLTGLSLCPMVAGENMDSTFVATLRKSGNSMVLTVPDQIAKLFKIGKDVKVTINDMEIEK